MRKKDIIDYCLKFPAAYEDYPFDENWTVMRHSGNKKSFAFIYERNNKLCVNLKCEPSEADILRRIYKDITPAYHMNKEHWNTVTIGGDVSKDALFYMINHSYLLIEPVIKGK